MVNHIALEPLVRPWFQEREPVNPRPREQPPAGDEGGDAFIAWGTNMPSQIDSNSGPGFTVKMENTEIRRVTHDKRVENPEDPNQYVDVEVIDRIEFELPDGTKQVFVLSNPD